MEESSSMNDEMEESSSVNYELEKSNAINSKAEESVDDVASEVEDLDISDVDEASTPGYDVPLNIDCNARFVTDEVKCDDEGDNCDMLFVDKNCLSRHRGSEAGLHTSTEDLNMSDEEGQSCTLAMKSVNLDGIACSSSKQDADSLSTLNYSHTVFKDGYNTKTDIFSNDESSNKMQEKTIDEDKYDFPPRFITEGLLLTIKTAALVDLPTPRRPSDSLNIKNMLTNPLLDESDMNDLCDGQESPPITLEYIKADFSDDHSIEEDASFGTLDDIIESSKKKNPFGKGYNAFNLPETRSEFSNENANDNGHSYLGDSRRSSAAEFTEDETFCLETFCDHGMKKVKKINSSFDKNEKSEDSITDEEVIEEQ